MPDDFHGTTTTVEVLSVVDGDTVKVDLEGERENPVLSRPRQPILTTPNRWKLRRQPVDPTAAKK